MHSLKKSLHCEACIDALTVTDATPSSNHSLINLKSKGRLIYPTDDVFDICVTIEKLFRESMATTKAAHFTLGRVASAVLQSYVSRNILFHLSTHMYDTEPHVNHLHLLTKVVAKQIFPGEMSLHREANHCHETEHYNS